MEGNGEGKRDSERKDKTRRKGKGRRERWEGIWFMIFIHPCWV